MVIKTMKDIVTQQLDKSDIEKANLISDIGNLTKIEGKIIVALIEKKELDTHNLILICDSVQPAISVATRSLIEKEFIWIEGVDKLDKQRGRMKNLYSLKISVKELITILEKGYKERVVKMETDIKKLKQLS